MSAWWRRWCCLWISLGVWALALDAWANPQPGLPPPPKELVRATPHSSLESFLEQTRLARFDEAAYLLDLRGLTKDQQVKKGPELARKLRTVLDRKLTLELADVSNDPEGDPSDGPQTDTLGTIQLADRAIAVKLSRVPTGPSTAVWVFAMSTVREIEPLYEAFGPGLIGENLPGVYQRRSVLDIALWQWIALALACVGAVIAGYLVSALLLVIGRRLARTTKTQLDDVLLDHLRGPVRAFVALWLLYVSFELIRFSLVAQDVIFKLHGAAVILAAMWAITRVIHAISEVALGRMVVGGEGVDEALVRRGQRTRVETGRRFINALVLFVGVAVALMQFEVVRTVGVSLLASAGVIGVVLGFAAQKSVANLVAGIQLSVAQPIRIGDRVHISGDVGWIEEITLTYVTMKTWDGRRRVFPITYFIENQFENWTKTSPQLVGQVVLHADYRVPVDVVREAVTEMIREDEDWDGEVADVFVVDATADSVVLRITASSPDAGRSWALRCRVRERAIAFLQQLEGGRYLPRHRVELPTTA